MKFHDLLEQSYQAFLEQAQDVKLVLLHPDNRFRSMLVAKLMNTPEFDTFYYAIRPDDVDLRSFLTRLTDSYAKQHVTFGRYTNILPHYALQDPIKHFDMVLDAFIEDIDELSDRDFILIFDEYDRSDRADEVQRFVERLSNRLPENGRIVLNSRTLSRLPWVSLVAQRRAVMLHETEPVEEQYYGTQNYTKDNSDLQVYALGNGIVNSEEETIDLWEGHLPRLLFFFALDRPMVTRTEICNAFWPELDVDQAVNVFHVTKRRLHKALGEDILVHEDGYYRVNPNTAVYYDAIEFVNLLVEARRTDDADAQFNAWQRAVDLYRGPFLKGHTERWITERREEFKDGYLEALVNLAYAYRERGDKEYALSLLQKALEQDNLREDIHRGIMSLYSDLSRRSEIAAHYKQMQEIFRQHDLTISEETQQHYKKLMS